MKGLVFYRLGLVLYKEEEEEEGLMREVSGLKDGCIIGLSPRPPTTCALIIFMIMKTFMAALLD